ncbi:hypothetical protein [Burkholderia sp. MSMB1078WGS]|nr:hypothetical protein [Burkholderia sp. MSMB1078WGS]
MFDAVGDDARFRHDVGEMIDSRGCFVDLDEIDGVPTNRHVAKGVRG